MDQNRIFDGLFLILCCFDMLIHCAGLFMKFFGSACDSNCCLMISSCSSICSSSLFLYKMLHWIVGHDLFFRVYFLTGIFFVYRAAISIQNYLESGKKSRNLVSSTPFHFFWKYVNMPSGSCSPENLKFRSEPK